MQFACGLFELRQPEGAYSKYAFVHARAASPQAVCGVRCYSLVGILGTNSSAVLWRLVQNRLAALPLYNARKSLAARSSRSISRRCRVYNYQLLFSTAKDT
jgi:hypothetical protein